MTTGTIDTICVPKRLRFQLLTCLHLSSYYLFTHLPLFPFDLMLWMTCLLDLMDYFSFMFWTSTLENLSIPFYTYVLLMARSPISNFSIFVLIFPSLCSPYIAMSVSDTVGPANAPWDTPDPLTCVRQLQSLVGLGFNVGHESAGDLQTLIQSAMSGIRKEVDLHADFMGTEHVEHKTDHQLQRKMVRFWKCSAVTLHENQTFYVGDTEPESDHVYYQWNKMKNLPGWWVKKIWHSYDGWLLVAKKEEFSLLVFDPPRQLDQRVLVEETISSEGSMESQRQTLVANMSKRALQTFLHLPEDALSSRPRSRSPRGDRSNMAAEIPNPIPSHPVQAAAPANSADQDGDNTMPMAM